MSRFFLFSQGIWLLGTTCILSLYCGCGYCGASFCNNWISLSFNYNSCSVIMVYLSGISCCLCDWCMLLFISIVLCFHHPYILYLLKICLILCGQWFFACPLIMLTSLFTPPFSYIPFDKVNFYNEHILHCLSLGVTQSVWFQLILP